MGLLACDRLPQGDRNTPDLVGRILRSGQPLANVAIIVARSASDGAVGCDDELVSTRTDEQGRFVAHASRRWRSSAERPESNDSFLLCIRPEGAARFDTLFRAMATRWDSLQVECDISRAWLQEDQYGSTGQCLITRYALDGQPLAMQTPPFPPRTCDTTATEIGPKGIGPIRSYGDIGQLRRVCPGIRDTMFAEPFQELPGAFPRLVLDISGEPVVFRNVNGTIRDIVVSSPKFRTSDGLSVGMPMSRLAERTGLKALLTQEASGPYVLAWDDKHCGMAFGSDRPGWNAMSGESGQVISTQGLRAQPAVLRLRRIYMGVCMNEHLPSNFREGRQPPGERALSDSTLRITFLANAGVMLSAGEDKVLIDGLFRPYRNYAVPDDQTQLQLALAQPPFADVDAILVTHFHGDHFAPEPIASHLRFNRSAAVMSSPQVIDSLRKGMNLTGADAGRLIARRIKPGESEYTGISGITIYPYRIAHGGEQHRDVEHLAFIVQIGAHRVLHVGDADITEATFAPLGLHKARIDIALIPYWALVNDESRRVIAQYIQPTKVVAIHVDKGAAAGRRIATEVGAVFPGATTFHRPGQVRVSTCYGNCGSR